MGTTGSLENERVILFDGVCNLCNGSVQFVIRHDSKNYYKFASLQSSTGQTGLRKFGLPANELYSVILIKDGVLFQKSNAALEIVKNLDGLWPTLYVFKLVPRFFRDWVYGWVARNRYRWFGKKDACMIPTPELKSRFLDP